MPYSTLQVLDENTVESSDGWRVHFAGHSPLTWRIVYQEGPKQIEIPVEGAMSDEVFFFVYLSAVQDWSSPRSDQIVTSEDRKRIAKNVQEALAKLNTPCRIE